MGDEVWVFAYGSLMWEPGVQPVETVPARLTGYARRFCLWSIHFRGTPEAPGLVLALDPAKFATCDGLALRLPDAAALAAIRERELISDAYEERRLPVALADGRELMALAYLSRPGHAQHAMLPPEAQAVVIARARGARGANREYLERTAAHLRALGIIDPDIEALLDRVNELPPSA